MRVAYLCADRGVPVFGSKGASVHVRELVRALASLGHEVFVVAARLGDEPPRDLTVPVVELPPESSRSRALLRDFAPDVVYERHALFSTAGPELAAGLSVPLIKEVNAPLSDEQAAHRRLVFAEKARAIERETLLAADQVIAVSSPLRRWLLSLGVREERITVLANGVDVRRFEAASRERDRIRAELGLERRPVIGFVGTLKPWHDLATLAEAFVLLRRRRRDAKLLVVGDGPGRATLEGLDGAVLTGSVAHEQVPALLAAIDVAVAPCVAGPASYFSPLKLFEYLAAGRPVVAAPTGDVPHCIRPAVGGLLYEPADAAELAAAVERLVDDPAGAAALGRRGREHVRAYHTWRANAEAVVRLTGEIQAVAA